MNNSSFFVTNVVSIPLAGVSTIACIIALGVLLYYKMWRSFIYRLVLYMFISLIVSSLGTIILVTSYLLISNEEYISYNWANHTGLFVPYILMYGSLAISNLLVTSMTVCIYLMALHNYQFTYKSDLCLFISFILYLMIIVGLLIPTAVLPNVHNYVLDAAILVLECFPLPMNIVFTALTLVPLCCRACGYNLCMKTAATIESHRKALGEILPLFILIVPSFFVLSYLVMWLDRIKHYNAAHVFCSILGLVAALSFALHLCFIRKNLKKIRARKKTANNLVNLHCTHRTTVFTSTGISDSCIIERPLLIESMEDSQYLLIKSN